MPANKAAVKWASSRGPLFLHLFPVCLCTVHILYVYDGSKESTTCVCLSMCWIHPLLLISCFFLFPPPKLSPVILAICLFYCYTCLLSFQRSGRQIDRERREGEMEREREDGKQSRLQLAGSTLCPVDSIWMQRKRSLPDGLEEQTEQCVERWMGGWMYVARPWKLIGGWLLCYSIYATGWVFSKFNFTKTFNIVG